MVVTTSLINEAPGRNLVRSHSHWKSCQQVLFMFGPNYVVCVVTKDRDQLTFDSSGLSTVFPGINPTLEIVATLEWLLDRMYAEC